MRSIAYCLLRTVHIVVLAFAPLFVAHAADWRYREPQSSASVQLSGFVTAADGRIWSWSGNTVYRSDADGNTHVMYRSDNVFGMRSTALADGSVVLVSNAQVQADGSTATPVRGCSFLHLGAGTRPPRRITQPDCKSVAFNADGSAWVGGATALYRVGLDGVQRHRLEIGAQETINKVAALADGGVLVQSQAGDATGWRLSRFDQAGGLVWERRSAVSFQFAAVSDGGAFMLTSSNRRLQVTRLDASGATRWSRDPMPFNSFVMQAEATSDNALYVVGGETVWMLSRPTTLLHISSDGAISWDRPFCDTTSAAPQDAMTIDSNGNSAVVCAQTLLRRGRDGETTARITLPFDAKTQLSAEPGGTLRILGQQTAANRSLVIDVDAENRIHSTGVDNVTDNAPLSLRAGAIDSDGASYLLSDQTLSKLSPAGSLLWRTDAPTFQLQSATLSVANRQVCARQYHSVPPGNGNSHRYSFFCLDTDSGRVLWRSDTPPGTGANEHVAATALDDGNSLTLVAITGSYTLDLRDRNGSVLRHIDAVGQIHSALIDRKGRAFLLVDGSLVHYAADGQRRYQVPGAVPGYPTAISSDDAGNVYILGSAGQDKKIWAVGASGTTRWIQTVGSPAGFNASVGQLMLGSNAVYVMQFGRLSRFASTTGEQQWQYDSTNPRLSLLDAGGRMALNVAGNVLVQVYSGGDRLRFERIDASSGSRLGERVAGCGITCGQVATLALDTEGSARVLLDTLDNAGQSATAMAISGIAADAPRTRLDQPGITGAWWSPYANGEGLAFDWLPTSRTLFGAWFTYSNIGGNDPAELRWYTVQASGVASSTTQLELPILETTGGNFAAGPPVSPRRVGSAIVTFSDCNNGLLDYAFDAGHNDARSGTITLSRLSPATQPCVLADGSSMPGAGAQLPANGFDANLSGSWFD
ncbi:MAG TPA: PQQ-binding-like beta-propeller repeat protein, partial [Tahibacter sp.]|nr:PQQ-binding-like beta-propeller repeat protein [Tahibacter sp.]